MDRLPRINNIPSLGSEDRLRLYEEQARAVYQGLPLSFFVNITLGTVLAVTLKDTVSPYRLVPWLVALLLVQGLRYWMLRGFRSQQFRSEDIRRWVHKAVGGAAATGIVWGLASMVLWSETDLTGQTIIIIVVAGIIAGAVTTLSPILTAAISFLYCALVPLIARLSLQDSAHAGSLLFMTVLFLLLMTITARRSNRLLLASLITQIEKERAEQTVRWQATYDELTGLSNRRHLVHQLQREFSRAIRHQRIGALLFIDIDNFKNVNDTLGHDAGDQLLKGIAHRISERLRAEDTASRLGGDEFVLLFPELTEDKDKARIEIERIAKHLMQIISARFMINGHEVLVSASIGVALIPDDGRTPDELLKHADTAMYRAKEQGRNGYQIFVPAMQQAVQARLELERGLRYAIAYDKLVLQYQPQVDCSGTVRCLEALVRWEHPAKGLIMPDEFMSVAEQTGLVVQLTRWVAMRAFRDLVSIKRLLPSGMCPSIAINISASDFRRDGLLDMLRELATAPGFQKGDFCLELTEHTVMENYDAVVETMHCARKLGFRFAIDDFGTGHSSLACLKRLPVDVLKIDRSFVQDILDDANDAVIVQTIVGMAENLGLETVAEGVETRQIHAALRQFGCRYFQGWHFGRPEPLETIVARLQNCQAAKAEPRSDSVGQDATEFCQ